jgi:hypothetical protein
MEQPQRYYSARNGETNDEKHKFTSLLDKLYKLPTSKMKREIANYLIGALIGSGIAGVSGYFAIFPRLARIEERQQIYIQLVVEDLKNYKQTTTDIKTNTDNLRTNVQITMDGVNQQSSLLEDITNKLGIKHKELPTLIYQETYR